MNKKKVLNAIELLNKELADLASRPFAVGTNEQPVDVTGEAVITEADENRVIRRAARFDSFLGRLLNAEVEDDINQTP
jgi:hypothetical protein